MPLDHKPPKVVAAKGQKKVRYRTSGNKSQVTVIACVSASGHAIPPFVIFDAKRLNMDWTNGEVPGTRYGLSSTGWVDTYPVASRAFSEECSGKVTFNFNFRWARLPLPN